MPRLDPAEVGFTPEGFALDMPTRPAWQGVVSSAEELHALEEQSFLQWQQGLLHKAAAATADAGGPAAADVSAASTAAAAAAGAFGSSARAGGVGRLSFYEGRLEFWRQLWRTLEMSDLVLMIVDARNPLLHFSHALYRHITQHHGLPLVLLLNKCDLVPAAAAAAWKTWLQQQLPGVAVVPVSAAAGQAEAAARQLLEVVLQQRVERGGQQVLVQDFIGSSIDGLLAESLRRNLHAKRHLQQQHTDAETHADGAAAAADAAAAAAGVAAALSWQHDAGPVVVGLLGEPNVGKSSTLNALLGTHRVAVSCHPGRTKHYQTHFMSSRLVLCDCPGIVFPRLDVSLPMQVLFGSYPIASCRQPYAVVRYLASASWPRLQQRLALSKPGEPQQQQQQLEVQVHEDANDSESHTAVNNSSSGSSSVVVQGGADGWSPWVLCEALAEKRHWVLPRSGRLDTYRAANWLLRAALGGQQGMGLAFLPPA
ncbi:hypothetical protein OEZ86_012488 [Tetradesmus obliquus]|nr:hypothetical protein OEZ86_012488 [Tetradesmus obliquus]